MTDYRVILYRGDENDATRQEALANIETVIEEWLEAARTFGRAISIPKGRLLFA